MASHPLAEFIEQLAPTSELLRVATPVRPQLEVAELTRQLMAGRGPVLLLSQVEGSPLPLVANLLGTEERLCRALEIDRLAELSDRLQRGLPLASQSWFERLRGGEPTTIEKLKPRSVKNGEVQQVVRLGRDIDLGQLPAVQSWPHETGPQLTAGRIVSTGYDGDRRSVELGRLVVLDGQRLALVDDGQHHTAGHWREHCERGERMPVAVTLGGYPADTLAAWLQLHDDVDGYLLAGLMRTKPVDLVKCRTVPQDVPSDADLVIEGYFDPADAPATVTVAGLATGHQGLPHLAPVMHVSAITSRTNPLVPTIIAGPGGELATLHRARERLLLPLVKAAIPELVDYSLPGWGGFERFALLAIRKTYPGQAAKAAAAFRGIGPLQTSKFVIVVDEHVDVHDPAQVLAALGVNVQPSRDLATQFGPAHHSDYTTLTPLVGHSLVIDATAKLRGEHPAAWPERLQTSDEILERVAAIKKSLGLSE